MEYGFIEVALTNLECKQILKNVYLIQHYITLNDIDNSKMVELLEFGEYDELKIDELQTNILNRTSDINELVKKIHNLTSMDSNPELTAFVSDN